MIAIPALDLRGGACVQLAPGSYDEEVIRIPDPVGVAIAWRQYGFRHLHVVDLDGVAGRGDNTAAIQAILDATGLTPWAASTAGRINLARRQRVALARALAMSPEVLLLDNPLGGPGLPEARWWRDFLAQLASGHELLRGRPLTLVIACHDLRPWADQGKQFALLKQKRWLAVGGRADLTCGHEPLLHELLATEFGVGQPGGY